MRIAVLGGGNGAFAAAGDLTLAGHEVRLWRRDPDAAAQHRAAGGAITVIDGRGTHRAEIALITSDIAAATLGAELILCPAPAFAQPDIAALLAPCLTDGQVVFLTPGTFGSYLMARAAWDAGNYAEVMFAETGTLPWLARKQGPYEVRLSTRAVRLPTGVFPQRLGAQALAVIARAFPGVIEDCGDALSGALMNAGCIIHPPLIIMNAGPIEHFERWDIHKEGTQPAIRRVTDRLDAERMAVREALGYGAPHFPLADHYNPSGTLWMYDRNAHDNLKGSGDWHEHLDLRHHRYMIEDTRLGLSLLCSAATLANVATPLAEAFMAIGSAIVGTDFRAEGRTLDGLGLGDMTAPALQALLRDGFA